MTCREDVGDIPAVCLIKDLARILRTSPRTIRRLRRHRALPIPEIVGIDKRLRWSGEAVRRFIESGADRKLRRVG